MCTVLVLHQTIYTAVNNPKVANSNLKQFKIIYLFFLS